MLIIRCAASADGSGTKTEPLITTTRDHHPTFQPDEEKDALIVQTFASRHFQPARPVQSPRNEKTPRDDL